MEAIRTVPADIPLPEATVHVLRPKTEFYNRLPRPVPTKITEAVGRIAGSHIRLDCTIEEPEDESLLTDEIPVVIAHGYFGAEPAYDDYRSQLAQRGRRAITWEPARSKGLWSDLNLLSNTTHPEKIACQTALGVVRVAQQYSGQSQIDGSGHSNGGQTLTKLACHRPEYFRTLTLIGSVGLDRHSLPTMIGRVAKFVKNDLLRPELMPLALRNGFVEAELKYTMANPPLTFAEAISAGRCNLDKRLQTLGQEGIPLGTIAYQNDDFFPLDDVLKDSYHLFDDFHIYRDPKMRHTGPQEDPSGTAEAQLEVINNLLND